VPPEPGAGPLPGSRNQTGKKGLRQRMRLHDPLWMPLNASYPVGIASPLRGFDYSIRRARDDAKSATRFQDRLVMRAIHLHFRGLCHILEARSRFDFHVMEKLG